MICTFFGHKDTPEAIKPKLYNTLKELIVSNQADTFYVGNQGNFDIMVRDTLKRLKAEYPQIEYFIVLAYMPKDGAFDGEDTIYPEGLERVPLKYAIDKRNRWLVSRADMIITYVTHPFGGASQYKELAEKKKKRVINLY